MRGESVHGTQSCPLGLQSLLQETAKGETTTAPSTGAENFFYLSIKLFLQKCCPAVPGVQV